MLRLDINLLFTIVNLLVLYLLMKKFLFSPVNAVLKKRKELLEQQYRDASLTKENALKLKDEYEAALKSAKDVSEQFVEDAKANARKEYDRIIKETDMEAKKMLEKAQQEIEMERSRTLSRMKSEVTELAMVAAAKIVSKESTEMNNHKLYDEFLSEIDEKTITDKKGKKYGQFAVEAGEL